MNKSDQLGELFSALAKAQAQIKTAVKDSANPFFKSTYTSLDGCWDACKAPLSSNGLTIVQTVGEESGKLVMTTILGHSSGQYISSTIPLLLAKQDPQSMGSAISYSRRYALCAMVGLTQGDDDDGEKAMEAHRNPPAPREMTVESFLAHIKEQTGGSYNAREMKAYLDHLERERGVTAPKIMEQALRPELLKRFLSGYEKHFLQD